MRETIQKCFALSVFSEHLIEFGQLNWSGKQKFNPTK